MNTFDTELLAEITRACRSVWNDIAPDCAGMVEDDAESEVEMCLDADRLLTFGHPNEYAAMKLLLEDGTFSDLTKAIARNW